MDFASVVEHAPDVIFSVDREGRVTYANAAVRDILGFEPTEVTGMRYDAFVQAADLERAQEVWRKVSSGQALRGAEFRARRRDGSVVHVLFDAVPHLDPSGRFIGAHGIARDITASRDLRLEHESLLERMGGFGAFGRSISATPDASAVLAAVSRYPMSLGADACWVGLVEERGEGLSAAAARGPGAEAMADCVVRACEQAPGRTSTGQAIQTRQIVVERLEGEPPADAPWLHEARAQGYLAVAVMPMVYGEAALGAVHVYSREAGFFDGWRVFLLEAFAHIAAAALAGARAFERASQSEARFHDLAEGLPCVVYLASPSWPPTILFITGNAERYTGYAPGDFYADRTTVLRVVHPEDRERFAHEVQRASKEPKPYSMEFRIVHRNGKDVYHVTNRSVPLLDSEGKVVLRQGVLVDVTGEKLLEHELLQSQRLAAIGEMAAMMAHEIRNPLAGMSLAIRTLRGDTGSPEVVQECLDDLEQCLRRINTTVVRALDYAKARPPQMCRCELPAVVEAACQLTATYIRRNQIQLETALSPDLPGLSADPDQLEQVFVNLILNACQAMPGGGGLTIRAWAEPGRLCAEVADTGTGIEAEDLGKIFTAFYSGFAYGTGLGLPLCQRIVQAHGGTIRAASTPGRGSTFHIELPLEQSDGSRPARR